mmetsp:Transcript_31824/g.70707  ORF Transcript_31824/g.70707 Transcript_31824/m.70707 type:complete len:256 (+) Transcript_31824:29-796(+)
MQQAAQRADTQAQLHAKAHMQAQQQALDLVAKAQSMAAQLADTTHGWSAAPHLADMQLAALQRNGGDPTGGRGPAIIARMMDGGGAALEMPAFHLALSNNLQHARQEAALLGAQERSLGPQQMSMPLLQLSSALDASQMLQKRASAAGLLQRFSAGPIDMQQLAGAQGGGQSLQPVQSLVQQPALVLGLGNNAGLTTTAGQMALGQGGYGLNLSGMSTDVALHDMVQKAAAMMASAEGAGIDLDTLLRNSANQKG